MSAASVDSLLDLWAQSHRLTPIARGLLRLAAITVWTLLIGGRP